MATRQYIGARYVPKFADPIEWDSARGYEALTIVTYLGNSYTSKKEVPAGVSISNNEYWVATGNYNAQVAEYTEIVNEIKDNGVCIATVFGVDNTGSEDAGAQINSLWDEHKSIFLPEGEYNIETAISIPSDCTLIGENGTILIHNVQENPGVFDLGEVDNIKIANLTIKGDVESDSANNVSTIYKSTNVTVENVKYTDLRGVALIISTNCSNITVKNCLFKNCGTYNRISGSGSDRKQALAVTSSCHNIQIINNTFNEIGLDAISVTGSTDINISENCIDDTDSGGIYVSTISGVIANNIVHDAGGNGIDCNTCVHLNVNGNYCYECYAAGIMLSSPENCSVIGNLCYGNVTDENTVHRGGITIHVIQNSNGLNISGNCVRHVNNTYELYSYYLLQTQGTLNNLVFNEDNASQGIMPNIPFKNGSVINITMGTNEVIKVSDPFNGEMTIFEINNATRMTAVLRGQRAPDVSAKNEGWISNSSSGDEKYLLYYDSTDDCYYFKNNQTGNKIIAYKLEKFN